MKDVKFVGTSLDDLRAFPKNPRQDMGRQINRIQQGLEPLDWKPMKNVGPGVREIRIRDEGKNYRGMYVTNLGEAVYVFSCVYKEITKDVEERYRYSSVSV